MRFHLMRKKINEICWFGDFQKEVERIGHANNANSIVAVVICVCETTFCLIIRAFTKRTFCLLNSQNAEKMLQYI